MSVEMIACRSFGVSYTLGLSLLPNAWVRASMRYRERQGGEGGGGGGREACIYVMILKMVVNKGPCGKCC